MRISSDHSVTRRKVFYIPGYDPFPPRRYRELYRKEGAAQAAISGYALDLTGATQGDGYGWQIVADIDGVQTVTDIEVLVWSDIVQDSQTESIAVVYWQLLRTAWIYISTGALFRLMRLRKGPVLAALYPVGMLLGQLGMAVFAFWGVRRLVAGLTVVLGQDPLAFIPTLAGIGCAALVAYAVLRWFRAQDGKLFAYYLMHDFAYSAGHRGEIPPELSKRMEQFAQRLSLALKGEAQEVLVVGHSSGAHLAVSILADILREEDLPDAAPALSFLSLGQVVPMVSFLPAAHRLRRDLGFLSQRADITWIDVTAPGDGCSFALCDPVAVSGLATPAKRWPLVFSAAFTQSLSPERWHALRWRFFRLHFQYLCAFDRPKDYDYFQITAGPMTLGARYADRQPSRSRIEKPVNRYTSAAR